MNRLRHPPSCAASLRLAALGCTLLGLRAFAAAAPENATRPGRVAVRTTWACAGINWPFAGDSNRNAAVSVEFRRAGATAWRPALPLLLHEYGTNRMFSGSVFRLAAGTAYEFRLCLRDADNASPSVTNVIAATRPYPALPARVVNVPTGGLARGSYPGETLRKSGLPGQPIVYRAAPREEVIIRGRVSIEGSNVWLHGLTLLDPTNAVLGHSRDVCITQCRMQSHYSVHTPAGADGYFISDNRFHGDSGGRFTFSGEGVDFGADRGGGHAVCFNEITESADGVSYGGGNIDVYGNFIHETVDDFIEPDYARENYRVWENRGYNSMCGFSFQPMKGGPWYFYNNINVGAYLHALKVKDVTGPTVLCGNTILTKSSVVGQGADVLRGTFVNNLWLRTTKGPVAQGGSFAHTPRPTVVDFNAYGTGGADAFGGMKYAEQAASAGWDRHSLRVDASALFVEPPRPPKGEPRYWSGMTGTAIGSDWYFDHNLLLPRGSAPIVDAGTVLPNITGPYLGRAPDLGAHEAGLGTAWYGPRTWDDAAGLVYGVPDGWRKAALSAVAECAGLGCPATPPGARVLLVRHAPDAYALLCVEPGAGNLRWERAQRAVAADAGALTPVLEFQDGLFMRLYDRGASAALVAARVEENGVLVAVAGCRTADLPAARLDLFQFARSLCR